MGFLCFGKKKKRSSSDGDASGDGGSRPSAAQNGGGRTAELKLLLLGAGQSGKTTILKQMKLIHDGGFTAQERIAFRSIVYSNIFTSMKALVAAMEPLGITYEKPDVNGANAQLVMDSPVPTSGDAVQTPVWEAVRALWADKGIQECFAHAGKDYQLIDNIAYFMDAYERVSQQDYVPDDQDILHARTTTTGITETSFRMGDVTYRMYDVGGQRSERKKWIHCFENVTAIIFMVAISEYDLRIVEDASVNRMQEALTLFDSVCNSRWFAKTSIILFMNKIDRFREKIEDVPVSDYFPDYTGGADYDEACEYFKNRFVQLNQSESKQIYTHFTCATDTQQIRFVMAAVNDIIIQSSLRQAGLL